MLNVTNHQENANQNYTEISPQLVRMTIIKNTTNNKCWWGYGEKRTLLYWWWACKLVQALWKWYGGPQISKNSINMIQQFQLWIFSQRKQKTLSLKRHMRPHVTAVLFTRAKIGKQSKCRSTKLIDKEDMV